MEFNEPTFLIIVSHDYKNTKYPLGESPHNDAKSMISFFARYHPKKTMRLTNPDISSFIEKMKELRVSLATEGIRNIIFFYAGHGGVRYDKSRDLFGHFKHKHYILLSPSYDCPNKMETKKYELGILYFDYLYSILSDFKVTMILDCCRFRFNPTFFNNFGEPNPNFNVIAATNYATDACQDSFHGVFTEHLLKFLEENPHISICNLRRAINRELNPRIPEDLDPPDEAYLIKNYIKTVLSNPSKQFAKEMELIEKNSNGSSSHKTFMEFKEKGFEKLIPYFYEYSDSKIANEPVSIFGYPVLVECLIECFKQHDLKFGQLSTTHSDDENAPLLSISEKKNEPVSAWTDNGRYSSNSINKNEPVSSEEDNGILFIIAVLAILIFILVFFLYPVFKNRFLTSANKLKPVHRNPVSNT